MIRLGLPDVLDHRLSRQCLPPGLSWGWIASLWLAHILTQSDHCKQPVRAWVRQTKEKIEWISKRQVRELDFMDDRLAKI
jgi:transposase